MINIFVRRIRQGFVILMDTKLDAASKLNDFPGRKFVVNSKLIVRPQGSYGLLGDCPSITEVKFPQSFIPRVIPLNVGELRV